MYVDNVYYGLSIIVVLSKYLYCDEAKLNDCNYCGA